MAGVEGLATLHVWSGGTSASFRTGWVPLGHAGMMVHCVDILAPGISLTDRSLAVLYLVQLGLAK